jgi:hypothetical protein
MLKTVNSGFPSLNKLAYPGAVSPLFNLNVSTTRSVQFALPERLWQEKARKTVRTLSPV